MVLLILSLALNAIFAGAMAASDSNAGSSNASGATASDDSGFRPGINGFAFQNYGDDIATVDLTPAEMHRMFGDKVCACLKDGNCTLTYPAQMWMEAAISAMRYGHCEGLAVLSDLIYYSKVNPSGFGGQNAIDLSLKDELLQREIGYWWVTQVTSPGGSERIKDSPNVVLDTLAQSFALGKNADEWWVMGLYLPDGSSGHAITPYAVEDMGNGISKIMVYDNNWPKSERYVEVNRTANTWSYQASINPNEKSTLYTGNASTKTLEIVSISSRLGQQKCEFCDADNSTASNLGSSASTASSASSGTKGNMQIWQNGKAKVLVTDDEGREVGFLDTGQMVNEIPDAEIRILKFAPDEPPMPVIFVPLSSSDDDTEISVNVSSTAANDSENMSAEVEANLAKTSIIAPGFALSSEVNDLQQGQHQSIDLVKEDEEYSMNITGNLMEAPMIAVGTDLNQITISGLNALPGKFISFSLNPASGAFNMLTGGAGLMQFKMNSTDPLTGALSTFLGSDLSMNRGDSFSLNLANSFGGAGSGSSPSFSIDRAGGLTENVGLKDLSATNNMNSLNSSKQNQSNVTTTAIPISAPSGMFGSSFDKSDDDSDSFDSFDSFDSSEMPGFSGGMPGGFNMPSGF
ncbi:MAG: hypothetical protein LUQ63_01830 [Methanothrix sp.]|nr:hypothetical protein [Methanothrix sp.]